MDDGYPLHLDGEMLESFVSYSRAESRKILRNHSCLGGVEEK